MSNQSVAFKDEPSFRSPMNGLQHCEVIMLDSRGYILNWSVGAERIKGYTAHEIVGQHISCFFRQEDIESNKPLRDLELAKQQGQFEENGWRVRKDGSQFWAHVAITSLQDEQGQICGFAQITRDLTAETATDGALKPPDRSLQTVLRLFSGIDDAIFIHGLDGSILEVNQTMLHLYNVTREQALRLSILNDYSSPSNPLEQLPNLWQRAINGEIQRFEWIARRPNDGTCFNAEVTLQKLTLQDRTVILSSIRNVSDRKLLEKQLARQQARFNAFFCNANVGLVIMNDQLRHVHVNQTLADSNGLSVEAHLGKTLSELLPDVAASVEPIYQHVLATGQPILNLEVSGETFKQPGVVRHWLASYFPLIEEADGKSIGAGAVIVDITERKQAEEALRQSEAALREKAQQLEAALWNLQQTQAQMIQSEKMSSLGQLIAGVAHEINNPVSFIYGNLRYADDYTQDLLTLLQLYQQHYPHPVPEVQKQAEAIDLNFLMTDLPKLLSSMKVGSERIQKIVLSLRTFSHMDETEMKAVNIHEGIDNTLLILQNRLKVQPNRPAIEVTKRYGDVPLVECYAGQLNQVFMNILSNAIDALEVSIAQQPDQWLAAIHIQTQWVSPDRVQIQFIDNGPGIAADIQPRLFDPFFTTKPVGKGTGLGLSISYQIVTERHSGELRCISSPGQGTEFVIEIPVRQSSPS